MTKFSVDKNQIKNLLSNLKSFLVASNNYNLNKFNKNYVTAPTHDGLFPSQENFSIDSIWLSFSKFRIKPLILSAVHL